MEKIGVVGLGRMGSAIALRMQSQGHEVTSWTRSGRSVAGISITETLHDAVAQSDTLILSLYDDDAVAHIVDQILAQDLSTKQIIDTSTVAPDILRSRIDAIMAKGGMAVDAPISGGPEMVAAGTCGVLMGGSDAHAARAMTALEKLTARKFHVGPLGAGLVMKTINNAMLQAYMSGLDELLPVAKHAGIPFETALNILLSGPAGVPMLKDRLPKVLGKDDTVGFTINAVHKDNGVFRRVLADAGLDTTILDLSAARQRQAIAAGMGELDPAALVRLAYDHD